MMDHATKINNMQVNSNQPLMNSGSIPKTEVTHTPLDPQLSRIMEKIRNIQNLDQRISQSQEEILHINNSKDPQDPYDNTHLIAIHATIADTYVKKGDQDQYIKHVKEMEKLFRQILQNIEMRQMEYPVTRMLYSIHEVFNILNDNKINARNMLDSISSRSQNTQNALSVINLQIEARLAEENNDLIGTLRLLDQAMLASQDHADDADVLTSIANVLAKNHFYDAARLGLNLARSKAYSDEGRTRISHNLEMLEYTKRNTERFLDWVARQINKQINPQPYGTTHGLKYDVKNEILETLANLGISNVKNLSPEQVIRVLCNQKIYGSIPPEVCPELAHVLAGYSEYNAAIDNTLSQRYKEEIRYVQAWVEQHAEDLSITGWGPQAVYKNGAPVFPKCSNTQDGNVIPQNQGQFLHMNQQPSNVIPQQPFKQFQAPSQQYKNQQFQQQDGNVIPQSSLRFQMNQRSLQFPPKK
ncbi:hypothetical protein Sarmat_01126 [Rickettsiales endosymbiont of Paramecium tredecaurelia]|uniref:hypothetical protein n=1 Tax=Candidatus Sarmatiella mevalonica TaxID=2770581 RepID=UPI001921F2F4|nr:hypothetical protein [Candidatus Sarmatiella mevalonica]MBL3285254.1 hypothetical protein [Candidatus Sarmatiella mevalonica]